MTREAPQQQASTSPTGNYKPSRMIFTLQRLTYGNLGETLYTPHTHLLSRYHLDICSSRKAHAGRVSITVERVGELHGEWGSACKCIQHLVIALKCGVQEMATFLTQGLPRARLPPSRFRCGPISGCVAPIPLMCMVHLGGRTAALIVFLPQPVKDSVEILFESGQVD